MRAALGLLLLLGCRDVLPQPEDFDIEDLAEIAEQYCAANPQVPCGHVWMCETPADNDLGLVEICVLDETIIEEVEGIYGPCVPTPRHVGLCLHCCPTETMGCSSGCNAYSGCYCGAL